LPKLPFNQKYLCF